MALRILKGCRFDDATLKPIFCDALKESIAGLELKHLLWYREALDAEIKRRKEE